MQVLANIDEADVGQLTPRAKVSFTVDAFPQETFTGVVSQIRLSPMVLQNVVTYTAVIDVANPKMQLKPGMTATVTAAVQEKHDVLTVPNSALRFRPDTAPPAPAAGSGRGGSVLWKLDAGALKPVRVKLGMTDGASTEIITSELSEGDQIATAQQPGAPRKNTTAPSPSPFGGQGAGRRRM